MKEDDEFFIFIIHKDIHFNFHNYITNHSNFILAPFLCKSFWNPISFYRMTSYAPNQDCHYCMVADQCKDDHCKLHGIRQLSSRALVATGFYLFTINASNFLAPVAYSVTSNIRYSFHSMRCRRSSLPPHHQSLQLYSYTFSL